MKNKFDSTIFRASRYTISPDGRTFTQDGEAAKIIKLTDEELVVNLEEKGVIEYFKKVH
jgi:hypothetical protein